VNAAREDVLNGAPVKVSESFFRHAKLLDSPQKVKVLLGSFYSQVRLPGPGEVIFDEHTEELLDFLYFSSVDVYGGMTPPPQDGGVVRKPNDGVGAVCGYTVIRVQGVQEGNEYAALRGSGAQGQYRGGEIVHSLYLPSACREVQDPVAKRGVKPQAPVLGNELSWHNIVEC